MFAAFQTVVLDDKGTDCNTKKTLKFYLDKRISRFFLYRYIVDSNGNEIQITPDSLSNYEGKIINLRSPMFCTSEKICNKCAGELFYKLDIKTIGLTASKLSGSILNLSLIIRLNKNI